MEFGEDEFDGAWARGTLFHLTKADFRIVLQKIRKFLKPNGIFYLQMMEGNFEGISNIGRSAGVALYSYYEVDELNEIMSKNDFSLIQEVQIEGWLNHYYRSAKVR